MWELACLTLWLATSATSLVLTSIPIEGVADIPQSTADAVASLQASLWQQYDDINYNTAGLLNEIEWQLREKKIVWAVNTVWAVGADMYHVVFPAADWGYERQEVLALKRVCGVRRVPRFAVSVASPHRSHVPCLLTAS